MELLKDESAVTAIEYGLLAALIAVVIIAPVFLAGQALNTIFTYIASCLTGASSGTGHRTGGRSAPSSAAGCG
ncbi:MAG: Flp family type IVb pilin [Proteobacteria bacterium]|nr:Flp family type IVb pilin [Pseudomonadota bacterium]